MKRFQYYKVASVSPEVHIGDPFANIQEILHCLHDLDNDVQLAVFPELCITGYTCQDLFYEDLLIQKTKEALISFLRSMPENLVVVLGLPLSYQNKLYNGAAICFNHQVLGFQAKTHIPSYDEFYETRWFVSANTLDKDAYIIIDGNKVPLSNHLLFLDDTTHACIGVEICEDLWVNQPISSLLASKGANIIANCSASNESITKKEYRRNLVSMQSAKTYTAYIYTSAGPSESTSDLVFSNHNLICENSSILAECDLLHPKRYITSEIDLQHLYHDRIKHPINFDGIEAEVQTIHFSSQSYDEITLKRNINPYPFIVQDQTSRQTRCQEILHLQAQGLATRLKKIHCQNVLIGISGGLDSTLALLVVHKAFQLCDYDMQGIHAITMPGFGTTNRTKTNAQKLMDLLGVSSEEIPIMKSVNQHFQDIHHDPNQHDVTYENAQARERTQILMDLANAYNAIVVGTGDLSELALGWCTYNGDHMSMYAVNASVPKTLVRYICETQAYSFQEEGHQDLYQVLIDICETPVSPELLPPDPDGKIQQKTEEVLGSYDLHDFFLYHILRFHESPQKIYESACVAFHQIDPKIIKKSIQTFYRRFFTQQFKRNCMPDGVKVGSICLSPRGDWRMPSDASANLWLQEIESL